MALRLSGLISGMDTDAIVKQLTSSYATKRDQFWKQKESLNYKQEAWKDLNKSVYDMYLKLSNLRLSGTYRTSSPSSSNQNVATVSGDQIQGQHNVTVDQLATQTFITGSKITQDPPVNMSGSFVVSTNGKEQQLVITPDMTMKDVARQFTEVGLVANYDSENQRLFLASRTTGAGSDFSISGNPSLLDAIGLGAAAIKQQGKDSKITLNGAEFTSSTNVFKVNGMTISAHDIGSTIVGTKTNDKIAETIKAFIKDYNDLIKKIDTSYNADSAKGYSPLTDDEKSVMSDKQIEEWEKKLKESALSKDKDLSSLGLLFKNTMAGSTLSSFGITLNNYFTSEKDERNLYSIDESKLMKAINDDPEKVIKTMTSLSAEMYNKLNIKMKSSNFNSAYKVYNDKQIKQQIEDYDKKITKAEAKIVAMEDKYYNQFSKMEKMLSQSQSQATYLSNFFGI